MEEYKESTKNKRERATRKQITFDLSDRKLKEFYPKPNFTFNPKYHNKAWGDISRFMKKNGFEHRQCSVYTSLKPMTRAEVLILVDRMVEKMLWLSKCLNAIDVTNIGRQHSLMQAVENSAIKLDKTSRKLEKKEIGERAVASDYEIQNKKSNNTVREIENKRYIQNEMLER